MHVAKLAFASATVLVLAGLGCATKTRSGGAGAAGTTGAAGTGAAGTTGAAGNSGSSGVAGIGAAGATGVAGNSGSSGATGTGAAGTRTTGAAGAGSTSGVDNGQLFRDAGAVTAAPDPVPTSDAGTRPDGAAPVAMGTLHIGGLGLTAVFTQKGADVTMVVTATGCAQGNHTIQIHGGFSCDNAGTQGGVWDGKRGDGIPTLVCGADKKGNLTYTRSGADPATNWTVGDHSTKTDVTLHPAMAEGNCGTFF